MPRIFWYFLFDQKTINKYCFLSLAETARFELAIRLPVYTLSRRAPSTTRTRLHYFYSFLRVYTISRASSFSKGALQATTWTRLRKRGAKISFLYYKLNNFFALFVVTSAISSIVTPITSDNFCAISGI